ncbi:hypothetical protein [Nonomuraea dietziae]|uniref:hypothetical protein n=1 Tax=Nonomuraea dietziae TaxID=65515 RepID=UPI0031E15CF6
MSSRIETPRSPRLASQRSWAANLSGETVMFRGSSSYFVTEWYMRTSGMAVMRDLGS